MVTDAVDVQRVLVRPIDGCEADGMVRAAPPPVERPPSARKFVLSEGLWACAPCTSVPPVWLCPRAAPVLPTNATLGRFACKIDRAVNADENAVVPPVPPPGPVTTRKAASLNAGAVSCTHSRGAAAC